MTLDVAFHLFLGIKGRPTPVVLPIGPLVQAEKLFVGKDDAIFPSIFLLQHPIAEVDSRFFVSRREFLHPFETVRLPLEIISQDRPDDRGRHLELTSSLA